MTVGASRERAQITRRAQDGGVHMQRSLPSSSYPARSTLTNLITLYYCLFIRFGKCRNRTTKWNWNNLFSPPPPSIHYWRKGRGEHVSPGIYQDGNPEYRAILITKNRDMKTRDVSHCVSSLLRKLAMLEKSRSFWKNCACPVYSFNPFPACYSVRAKGDQRDVNKQWTMTHARYSTYSCTVYETLIRPLARLIVTR